MMGTLRALPILLDSDNFHFRVVHATQNLFIKLFKSLPPGRPPGGNTGLKSYVFS